MSHNLTGNLDEWPKEIWSWSPRLGRWSPEHGAPTKAVQFELSTAHVDPREAYDYWRDIAYYYFEADRLPVDDRRDFEAHTKIIATPTGNIYAYESGPVSGRRTFSHIRADQGDSFDLGLVLAGRRRHRDETDAVQNAMQGEFFCYDAAKPSRVEWGYHRGIHLTIPRTMIASSIGDIPPATEIVKALATSPLAPFLQAHLRVLASTLDRLSQSERAIIFDHTVDLTLSVLRQAIQSDAHPNLITKRSYYLAAKRIIHNHFSDPNLDAIRLSEMLGCSRSTLYRAFAAEGWTVADYIKEVRLREAIHLLSSETPGLTVVSVSSQCGFVSPSHFGRVFRERFGMTPTEARQMNRPSHVETAI